jgi:hypothetical protein
MSVSVDKNTVRVYRSIAGFIVWLLIVDVRRAQYEISWHHHLGVGRPCAHLQTTRDMQHKKWHCRPWQMSPIFTNFCPWSRRPTHSILLKKIFLSKMLCVGRRDKGQKFVKKSPSRKGNTTMQVAYRWYVCCRAFNVKVPTVKLLGFDRG